MNIGFPLEQTVKARYSVRTYEERPLTAEVKERLNAYIAALSNPFSVGISFSLLEAKTAGNAEKLGTYGMIKGAKEFIGATVQNGELALEAYGYTFEKLILFVASLGLGTCWLGGTFSRGEFAAAMNVKESELFPAISPVGYPAPKRFKETMIRKTIRADQRKEWNTLFFKKDFSMPLKEAEAGAYAFPLEMVRLAPSASNKQPWRIVQSGKLYHFYEVKDPGYSDRFPYDIQRVDIGIAACHFHLAALEKDIKGKFERFADVKITPPEHTQYVFSWVAED